MRVQIIDVDSTRNPNVSFKVVDRYPYKEFIQRLEEDGPLTDTICLNLFCFRGHFSPEYVLINEVADITNYGMHGISVDKYEVIGSNGEDIFISITFKKVSS